MPLGPANAVAVVDLRQRTLLDRIPLPTGSGATGVAVINDSIAYVGNPGLNSVSRVNYLDGTTVEVPVGIRPQGIIFVRGRVFVLNGNVDPNGVPLGASWITVLDPATNRPASGVDSIALAGPGGAAFATPAADGQFYVVSRGTPGLADGRLSAVDPLARVETASFAGLGTTPGDLISDGGASGVRELAAGRRAGIQYRQQCHRARRRGRGGDHLQLGRRGRQRSPPLCYRRPATAPPGAASPTC